jgi:hypothetical protein
MNKEMKLAMLESCMDYQRKNNIASRCVVNSTLMYDLLISYGESPNIKTGVILSVSNNIHFHVIVHAWVECDGEIIDASYDVQKLPGKIYCYSVRQVLDELKIRDFVLDDERLRLLVQQMLSLKQCEKMKSNKVFFADKTMLEYYDDLLEHFNSTTQFTLEKY